MDPISGFGPNHPLYVELSQGHAIRLIELFPGERQSDISIRLSIHELDHAPEFEAISYVWGDPNDTSPILCNGKELHVTVNLIAVLRRARYIDRSRVLWADAICINQGNNREKSHHVAFMSRVYRQAKRVLIHFANDAGNGVKDIVELLKEHDQRIAAFNSFADMPVIEDSDPLSQDPRWKSLAVVSKANWFTRAWVLQEAGVATEPIVLYGDHEFSYRSLMRLERWILNRAPQLEHRYGIRLWTVHTDWEDWSEDWRGSQDYEYGVVDFLSQARSLECHDQRDHVYAFLGHPLLQKEDGSGPILQPDYALPLRRVFWQLTTQVLLPFTCME
jgi:Heterokaryon incompatibility protein (HET)